MQPGSVRAAAAAAEEEEPRCERSLCDGARKREQAEADSEDDVDARAGSGACQHHTRLEDPAQWWVATRRGKRPKPQGG